MRECSDIARLNIVFRILRVYRRRQNAVDCAMPAQKQPGGLGGDVCAWTRHIVCVSGCVGYARTAYANNYYWEHIWWWYVWWCAYECVSRWHKVRHVRFFATRAANTYIQLSCRGRRRNFNGNLIRASDAVLLYRNGAAVVILMMMDICTPESVSNDTIST